MNPLLSKFDTPFTATPFDKIKTEHFLPAIKSLIDESLERIAAIRDNEDAPTFENTIEAMEYGQEAINRATSTFFNLNSAETNDELQALAQEISPLLSTFGNDIVLDEKLYQRILNIPESTVPDNDEARMLYRKTRLSFERNGANLSADDKSKLRNIDQELGQLSLTFAENVLHDTNAFKYLIIDKKDLKGLPDFVIDQAADTAEAEGEKDNWVFTLKPDSYLNFMQYSAIRKHRENMFRAFAKRGMASEEKSNLPIIKQLVKLRLQRARLLGYKSHADYILEERMAKRADTVNTFLQTLKGKVLPYAKADIEKLRQFAKETDGIEELQKWDVIYYMEKLKLKELNIDDETLKPYLALPAVTDGIFNICQKLYGISFTRLHDVPVYHPEVEVYEVKDENDKHLALFYMDFYPRNGKRGGAWMTTYRGQYLKNGADHRPHVSIVCNFNRPGKKGAALLTFQELTTYFHEFGHALHGMLARGKYGSLSGTNVYWDFVELPSQLFENWCYEKESLDLFAQHIDTGEKIPNDILANIKKQRVFFEGYSTVRQLTFGLLDMQWHSVTDENSIPAVDEIESEVTDGISLFPKVENTAISPAFSHIFHGGYSAGYYSYKWSEMLEVQAFEVFKKHGIFDHNTATAFRKLLETGGAKDPAKLFSEFTAIVIDWRVLLRLELARSCVFESYTSQQTGEFQLIRSMKTLDVDQSYVSIYII